MKEDRERGKLDNPSPRRCWDWMIASGNCHYARNRSSFVTYRRVERHVSNYGVGGSMTFVAGVGNCGVEGSAKQGYRALDPDSCVGECSPYPERYLQWILLGHLSFCTWRKNDNFEGRVLWNR